MNFRRTLVMKNNLTILYVEDEQEIRENTQRPLSRLCDTLLLAEDGKEGLELYQQHDVDIIVSDINMPRMNGIDMTRVIKSINPHQHIIFTTAHSESGFFMDSIEMHVDGYILKPIDYKLLKEKILTITGQIETKEQLIAHQMLTNEITQLHDNILFVLDENKEVIFSNEKFLKFFHVSSVEEFNKKNETICNIFLENPDMFHPKGHQDWIQALQETKHEKDRVVSILDEEENPQTFIVSLKCIEQSLHAIFILTSITSITQEKDAYAKKAYTDTLTNIPNRLYFEEQFHKEIARYKRDDIPLSFIILDIDKFKNFNDTHGHLVGDEILKSLAHKIKVQTRETDIFARWGGEEFVKILANTSLDDAKQVAEKLRTTIENHTFENDLKVTCSFGVAEFTKDDTKNSLMLRADQALYRAKENGRNRVEI